MLNFGTELDQFINYFSNYSALCMFSHMTTKFNVNELFDSITQSEEFMDFIENNKDKTGKQVCTEFIKNSIYSFLDTLVDDFLHDPDLQNIFYDNSMSRDEQFKAFIGKTMLKFLTGGEELPDSISTESFKKLVQQFMKIAIEIKGDIEITSPVEFYHVIVNKATEDLVEKYHDRLDVLKLGNIDCQDEEQLYDSCIGMIDRFNTILNRKSIHTVQKRPRSDDNTDNTDNTDTTDSTNNTDSNKRDPKRPKK